MGVKETLNHASVLFYLVGICFGTPFAMTKIDVLAWNKTEIWKKLIRLAIGLGSYKLIDFLFEIMKTNSS
jgi:hypothetical protein